MSMYLWEDWAEIYSRRGRLGPPTCASKPCQVTSYIRSEHSLPCTHHLLPPTNSCTEQDDGDEEFTKSSKDETNGQQ